MKSTYWDTRATDSIIKNGQKGTEASISPQFLSCDKFILSRNMTFLLHGDYIYRDL